LHRSAGTSFLVSTLFYLLAALFYIAAVGAFNSPPFGWIAGIVLAAAGLVLNIAAEKERALGVRTKEQAIQCDQNLAETRTRYEEIITGLVDCCGSCVPGIRPPPC
jgi:hypothetical protein